MFLVFWLSVSLVYTSHDVYFCASLQTIDWNDASQAVPSPGMKKLIDATSTLHKLMSQTLDTDQLELVFCEIGIGLSSKIPAAYGTVAVSGLTGVGKDRYDALVEVWCCSLMSIAVIFRIIVSCDRHRHMVITRLYSYRLAADVKHLLSTLRRCSGLRRGTTGEGVGATDDLPPPPSLSSALSSSTSPTPPRPTPSIEHAAVLLSGSTALDSLESWLGRHCYGIPSQVSPALPAVVSVLKPTEPEPEASAGDA